MERRFQDWKRHRGSRAAPLRFPLFYGEDAGRLFTIHRKMTQACCRHSTHDPHVTHSTWGVGKHNWQRDHGRLTPYHTCPRTALGLAQLRLALRCGPGSGAPIGVQKYGFFSTPYSCTGSCSHAYGLARQDSKRQNTKTTKTRYSSQGTRSRRPAGPPRQHPCQGNLAAPSSPSLLGLRVLTPSTMLRPRCGNACVIA